MEVRQGLNCVIVSQFVVFCCIIRSCLNYIYFADYAKSVRNARNALQVPGAFLASATLAFKRDTHISIVAFLKKHVLNM